MINKADYIELSKFKNGPIKIDSGSYRIQRLIDAKLIAPQSYKSVSIGEMVVPTPDKWALTVEGEDALLDFENMRQKESDKKRQQRFENKISVLQVLVSLVTFILGLIVEHFSGITGIILQLFG